MSRPFKVKMTDAELDALGSLLSHDPDLVIIADDENGDGVISDADWNHLSSLYNRAQAVAHVTKDERST